MLELDSFSEKLTLAELAAALGGMLSADVAIDSDAVAMKLSRTKVLGFYFDALIAVLPAFIYLGFVFSLVASLLSALVYFLYLIINTSTPLYIGGSCVFVLFMSIVMPILLRPFFYRESGDTHIFVDAKQEPELFYFVNMLCKKFELKDIRTICLTMDVNVDVDARNYREAYAGELSLSLGLPLLANLNVAQLAALISHELGHYACPHLRFCYSVIRRVRRWGHRVVGHQDGWHASLESYFANRNAKFRQMIMLPAALGFKLVDAFFHTSNSFVSAVSANTTVELECLADQFQAQIIGSTGFEGLMKSVALIDQSYYLASEKAHSCGKCPEDFSRYVHEFYLKVPTQNQQFIEMAPTEKFSGWMLHPSPVVRSRRVQLHKIDACFELDRPAMDLFNNFMDYSKTLTRSYCATNGLLVEDGGASFSAGEAKVVSGALLEFTSQLFSPEVVWDIPSPEKFNTLSSEKLTAFLNRLTVSIRHNIPEFSAYRALTYDYEKQKARLHLATWLLKDGSRRRPSLEAIDKLKDDINQFEAKHQKSILTYRKSYGTRIAASVSLGRDNKAYPKAYAMLNLLRKMNPLYMPICESKIQCATLEQLLERRSEGDGNVHQVTISRFTRMLIKMIREFEALLVAFPPSLVASSREDRGDKKTDLVMQSHLDLNRMNGEDYERQIIGRFKELLAFYCEFNSSMCSKLAKFAEINEKKFAVEPVITVKLAASK
ncbi:MAG: hypothetical protein ACI9Y1_002869 [Lentisphaeria bacterium]